MADNIVGHNRERHVIILTHLKGQDRQTDSREEDIFDTGTKK